MNSSTLTVNHQHSPACFLPLQVLALEGEGEGARLKAAVRTAADAQTRSQRPRVQGQKSSSWRANGVGSAGTGKPIAATPGAEAARLSPGLRRLPGRRAR